MKELDEIRTEVENDKGTLSVWGEGWTDSRVERQKKLLAIVDAVNELHKPVDRGRVMTCCSCEDFYEPHTVGEDGCVEYPCPTVQAISGVLKEATK